MTAHAQALPPASAPLTRPIGAPRRALRLALLLARPGEHSRTALALPIVAYAVTTALTLVVIGGVRMFFTDPRALEDGYPIFAVLALVLLAVPMIGLGASAARLSARRRNDALATLRLLGATGAEVSAITVIEATALALAGSLLGVAVGIALLPLAGLLPFFGAPVGAAALWAGPALAALTVGAVTLIAALSAALGLRRVRLTPLGVARRSDPPRARATLIVVVLVAVAIAAMLLSQIAALAQLLGPMITLGVALGLFAGVLALVDVGGRPLVALRGRAIAKGAKDAAHLIAGSELAAHAGPAWRRVSGIAMVAFIAVVGGAGASIAELVGDSSEGTLFADIRTGVLVTLGIAFVLLACSVGVTQAASVLEDRELLVGLRRLGMPERELERARRIAVMTPLRVAALGGAAAGVALSLPIVGATVLVSPVSLLIIAATFAAGIGAVELALLSTRPLARAVARG